MHIFVYNMKKILLFIALAMPLRLIAQPDSNEIAMRKYWSIAGAARHGKMAWFTNHTDDETEQFQVYLQMDQDYYLDEKLSDERERSDHSFTLYFRKRGAYTDNEPSPLRVTYSYNKDLIKRVVITGSWYDVANLFVSYWQKDFNLKDRRSQSGEVAWLNSFGDRVAFCNVGYSKAKIVITDNKVFRHPEKY